MAFLQQIFFIISSFVLSVLPIPQYVEGVTGQPETFLPTQATNQTDKTISRLVYRGLFKYDIFGNLIPDLAESWSTSEDGLIYTIQIVDDAQWSDGTPVTSDDIIYTAFNSPDLQYVGTDKVDEHTVRFILPNKFSPFLSLLTNGIIKDQSLENYNSLDAPTNGEFRVLAIRKNGPIIKEVVLYSDDSEKHINKLAFRYYSNEDELITAAQLGEIDGFMSNEDVTELENFNNNKFPQQGVYFAIFFNLEGAGNEKYADAETRKKMENVINKEQLISDNGISVEGPISKSLFTDRSLEYNVYDPTISEDLDLDLTLSIPDLKQHRDVAERVQSLWKEKLGIDLKVAAHDPATFADTVVLPRNYELLLYGQEVGRDPDRYVNWHSTQKESPGLNLSKFEQVRADRALEEGRNAIDNDERLVHYHEFQKVLVEQVPAIFLYHPYKNYNVSKHVAGIGQKYTFTVTDRFLDFYNWHKVR